LTRTDAYFFQGTDMAKDYQEKAVRMLFDEFGSSGFSQGAADKLAELLRKADLWDKHMGRVAKIKPGHAKEGDGVF